MDPWPGIQARVYPVSPVRQEIAYLDKASWAGRARRLLWGISCVALFKASPPQFHFWRRFLLRLFGARIGRGAHIYPSAKIWAPWNLSMGEGSCLGPGVNCYCVDQISIGRRATVSQHAFLCSASHDIGDPGFRLLTAPITLGAQSWIAAAAFVGPGVQVGEGAVLGAMGCAYKDLKPWTVYGGNPSLPLAKRSLRKPHAD